MGVGSAGKTGVRAAATRGGSALALAWRAGRLQILGYGVLELVAAVVPVSMAWLTKLALDAIVGRPVGGTTLTFLGGGLMVAGVAAADRAFHFDPNGLQSHKVTCLVGP